VWGRLSSLPVRATFQSPDTELESSVNRQTRMSALQTLGSVPARPSSEFGLKGRVIDGRIAATGALAAEFQGFQALVRVG
jgi:hypothetical protein